MTCVVVYNKLIYIQTNTSGIHYQCTERKVYKIILNSPYLIICYKIEACQGFTRLWWRFFCHFYLRNGLILHEILRCFHYPFSSVFSLRCTGQSVYTQSKHTPVVICRDLCRHGNGTHHACKSKGIPLIDCRKRSLIAGDHWISQWKSP